MAKDEQGDEENNYEEEKRYKTKRKMDMSVNMDVETATSLWWALLGASLLIVGLILVALSYTTLQLLTAVPTNAAVNLPDDNNYAVVVNWTSTIRNESGTCPAAVTVLCSMTFLSTAILKENAISLLG